MVIAQLAWTTPYSLARNAISDLGATHCGESGGQYICSPWHVLFNGSAILIGGFMILGALFVRSGFLPGKSSRGGLGLVTVAGLGAIVVGVLPEDVNLGLHFLGSVVFFVGTGAALLFLGVAMAEDPRWAGYRGCSILSGVVTLATFVIYTLSYPVSFPGREAIERVVVAPTLLWLVVAGLRLAQTPPYARPTVR